MTTMTQATRQAILGELSNIHSALPARIVSYDHTKQKAQVQPVLRKNYTNGTVQDMAVINNVPVIFPRAGGASLTFPVNVGDYCLLVFSERSMDLWKNRGGIVTPTDRRKFDLSDAIAIMGLMPFNETSSAENNTDVLLNYQGANIRITASGDVKIETANTVAIGNSTTEVLEVISTLMTYLQGAAVTGAVLGGPLNPTFTAQVALLQGQLDAIKGTIS